MEPLELIPTASEYFTDSYQRIVRESGDDAIGRQTAILEASYDTSHQIDLGNVEDLDRIPALKKLGEHIDAAQGRAGDSIVKKLAFGQVGMFDISEVLDTVVTLGGGMRKSWRFVTEKDLTDMYELRRDNYEKQVEAFEAFTHAYQIVLPTLRDHRTVGDAVDAGAFVEVSAS